MRIKAHLTAFGNLQRRIGSYRNRAFTQATESDLN